jgi:hypothetical protein
MPEAIPAFDDPNAITAADDESEPNERRFVTSAWVQQAACSWLSILGVARTSESYPHDPHERNQYRAEL